MTAGTVAVITGAGRGIGRATTVLAARRGFGVVALDQDLDALNEIADLSETVIPIQGDVRDPDSSVRARRAAEESGSLLAWVNNAGVASIAPLHETSTADIDRTLAINVNGMVYGCREAVCSFVKHGVAGSIVNLSSIHAQLSFPGYAVYDASKGAVESLTRSVCVEYGHLGIRCNAVAPGAVDTAIVGLGDGPPSEQLRRQTMALAPMNRISSPEEIARLVVFLLSDEAPAINGHVLAADNGISARGHGWPSAVTGPSPQSDQSGPSISGKGS